MCIIIWAEIIWADHIIYLAILAAGSQNDDVYQ